MWCWRPMNLLRNNVQQGVQRAQVLFFRIVKCRVKFPCENLVNIRFLSSYFVNTHLLTHLDSNMGKLNVSMLRYLSSEEFRVLTAVSSH